MHHVYEAGAYDGKAAKPALRRAQAGIIQALRPTGGAVRLAKSSTALNRCVCTAAVSFCVKGHKMAATVSAQQLAALQVYCLLCGMLNLLVLLFLATALQLSYTALLCRYN